MHQRWLGILPSRACNWWVLCYLDNGWFPTMSIISASSMCLQFVTALRPVSIMQLMVCSPSLFPVLKDLSSFLIFFISNLYYYKVTLLGFLLFIMYGIIKQREWGFSYTLFCNTTLEPSYWLKLFKTNVFLKLLTTA